MIEYTQLLNKYASTAYSMYSKAISESEWGNKEIASAYLEKYYLFEEDYLKNWRAIQNSIFQNEDKGLPAMVFKEHFSLLAVRGGILFERKDFESLQNCIKALGDKKLIIIQNDFGRTLRVPPFRMMYPSDITWDELMSGNFISSVMFEMFANEYFVFSESGNWGKYSANDYEYPLDVIGFRSKFASIFIDQFNWTQGEQDEIREWLPKKYKDLVTKI